MATIQITLGSSADISILFAYPNSQDLDWTLCQTIEHWFNQTLDRDGYGGPAPQIRARAEESASRVTLVLNGDDVLRPQLELYATRLEKLLAIAWKAYTTVIPVLKKEGRWDPRQNGWRFFLPLGLPMVNQSTLQFFHYPPIKMLEGMQDYLKDPVPYRVEELLMQNGISDRHSARQFETIIDGAPIGAPDDAGSAEGGDKKWGYIPIQFFTEYQKEMVINLLNHHPASKGYTIPIVVYGSHPREIFSINFLDNQPLGINKPITSEIIPGLRTPMIGANHPYGFYWRAQVDEDRPDTAVGDGKMVPGHCSQVLRQMQDDLITAGWLAEMARDASQDGDRLLDRVSAFWRDTANRNTLCAMTQYQATLMYTDEHQLSFTFRIGQAKARELCMSHKNETCSFIA
jgi:hypothetical protein